VVRYGVVPQQPILRCVLAKGLPPSKCGLKFYAYTMDIPVIESAIFGQNIMRSTT